jgi:hypothetical protein
MVTVQVTNGSGSWWLGQVCVMDKSDGPCVVVCLHGLAGRLIRGGNQEPAFAASVKILCSRYGIPCSLCLIQ